MALASLNRAEAVAATAVVLWAGASIPYLGSAECDDRCAFSNLALVVVTGLWILLGVAVIAAAVWTGRSSHPGRSAARALALAALFVVGWRIALALDTTEVLILGSAALAMASGFLAAVVAGTAGLRRLSGGWREHGDPARSDRTRPPGRAGPNP